jgi:ABC-type transport system involved in multi-copper enzyme maturation permease subunit
MTTATVTERAGLPFERLLKVEWRKAQDTRAAKWLLGLTAALMVGLLAVPFFATGSIDQDRTSYTEFVGYGSAILLPAVVILLLTSEWTHRTVMLTFAQEPRRHRVLGAKVLAALGLGLAFAIAGNLLAFGALGLSDLAGRDVDYGGPAALWLWGFVLLNVLMAAGFGALLQNSASAITVFYVLPTVFSFLAIGALEDVGEYLDTSQTFAWLLRGDMDGHWGQLAVSCLVWVVVPLVVGTWRTLRREVK